MSSLVLDMCQGVMSLSLRRGAWSIGLSLSLVMASLAVNDTPSTAVCWYPSPLVNATTVPVPGDGPSLAHATPTQLAECPAYRHVACLLRCISDHHHQQQPPVDSIWMGT